MPVKVVRSEECFTRNVPQDSSAYQRRAESVAPARQQLDANSVCLALHGVVGSFLGDVDIMGMGLDQTGVGDADEFAVVH